jgi:predicted hydrocarbon binding protein
MEATGVKVIVKVIRFGISGTENFKKAVRSSEVFYEVAKKIGMTCKFTAQLIDFFLEGDNFCFIGEYIGSGSLQNVFNKMVIIPKPVCFS